VTPRASIDNVPNRRYRENQYADYVKLGDPHGEPELEGPLLNEPWAARAHR
jgi:hypothetical protein